MIVSFSSFGGVMPALEPAKLPDPHAVIANSCRFERGNLVPFRSQGFVQTTGFTAPMFETLHRLSSNQWIAWTGAVSVARGPMPIGVGATFDADFRLYFSGPSVTHASLFGSIQWPSWTTRAGAINQGSLSAPYFFEPASPHRRPLGVPPPNYGNRPGAVVATVGNPPSGTIASITNGNPVVVTTSAPHFQQSGNKVRFSGIPAGFGGLTNANALNSNTFTITRISATQFSINFDGTAWTQGVTSGGTWTRIFEDTELVDRIYRVTFVDDLGQEGAPGPASNLVAVGDGVVVNLSLPAVSGNLESTVGPSFVPSGWKMRIYRSATGNVGVLLLVAEVPISQATFLDNFGDNVLGEQISTIGYNLPPPRLDFLTAHPNGFLCGAVDNEAWFSEPFVVYAWPHRKVLSHRVVGMSVFGSTIVYCTERNPILGFGSDPGSITLRTLDVVHPCIARQSIVSTGGSVLYVSPEGLVQCDDGGARVVTYSIWNQNQWRNMVMPGGVVADMKAAWLGDSYWLSLSRSRLIRIQFKEGAINVVDFVPNGRSAGNYDALLADPQTGQLFGILANSNPTAARNIELIWPNDPGQALNALWRSRVVTLPRQTNFSVLQVFSPDATPWAITVRCITETGATISFTVQNNRPVRMPGGYMTGTWQVEIETRNEVAAVHFATTMSGLREIDL